MRGIAIMPNDIIIPYPRMLQLRLERKCACGKALVDHARCKDCGELVCGTSCLYCIRVASEINAEGLSRLAAAVIASAVRQKDDEFLNGSTLELWCDGAGVDYERFRGKLKARYAAR